MSLGQIEWQREIILSMMYQWNYSKLVNVFIGVFLIQYCFTYKLTSYLLNFLVKDQLGTYDRCVSQAAKQPS